MESLFPLYTPIILVTTYNHINLVSFIYKLVFLSSISLHAWTYFSTSKNYTSLKKYIANTIHFLKKTCGIKSLAKFSKNLLHLIKFTIKKKKNNC